jgi:hypothetical protein
MTGLQATLYKGVVILPVHDGLTTQKGGGALESYFAGTRDRDAAEAACTDTYSENDLQR